MSVTKRSDVNRPLTLTEVDANWQQIKDFSSTAIDDGTKGFHLLSYPRSAEEVTNGITPTDYEYYYTNPRRFGAKLDGSTDDTVAMQSCMDASLVVEIPPNVVMVVNPATPLIYRQGHIIYGGGLDSTIIYPTAAAGTVFKRVAVATDNSSVRNVTFDGIGIVFNHPATADPSNYVQYGFDMQDSSRATVRNCYAGNYNRGPLRLTRTEPAAQRDACQGYGILLGTTNGGNYAGGEVPLIENNQLYGCQKCIVVDDATLRPLSACYAANIRNNDIQIAESGIAFEQQYNAGSSVTDNTIQAIQNMRGSSVTTYGLRMAGRDCYIRNKYTEVTVANCDYILRLESTAKRNVCEMGLIGNDDTFIALISDNGGWGNHNRVNYAVPSTNKTVMLDGNVDTELGRDKARIIFDASAAVQGTAMAATVAANGTGDFTITFSANTFPDANYNYSIDIQIDGSGSGGSATVRTQAAGSLRIVTRNAAGAVADPLRTSVRCG